MHEQKKQKMSEGKHQGKIIKRFHKRTHAFLWIRLNKNKKLKFKS